VTLLRGQAGIASGESSQLMGLQHAGPDGMLDSSAD
jgi:hypothetical protein